MYRRSFLSAIGAASCAALCRTGAAQQRPNFIFILTDDMGWSDPACFGHPFIKTPNIDRLAAQGTMYRQFYVNNPVCSPSRTAFMTGHYPARHGVHGHFATHEQNAERGMPNWLDAEVPTLPKLLQGAGYATAHFGKWHLGSGPGAPGPEAYGFDVHRTVNANGPGWDEQKDKYFRAHSTGLFVDETLKFIEAHKDRPFYVNLWTLVPHAKLEPTPEELAVYADLEFSPEDFDGQMQEYLEKAPDMLAQIKVFAAAVTGLDKALGRLFDALDTMGLTENTVILFSSDNGPEDYQIGNARNAGVGYPGDHRGRKRSIYEGGVRTPCIVRWPGHVAPGAVDEGTVLTAVDWLPTACAMAGVAAPAEGLDGEDMSDILRGAKRLRRKPIFWEWRFKVWGGDAYWPPQLAVRQGDWKFFVNPDGSRPELYNIPADQGERNNVAAQHPEVVAELQSKLLAWAKTLPQ